MQIERRLLPLLGLLALPLGAGAAVDSVYTRLALDTECPEVRSDPESGASVNRCRGVGGYQLLVEYDDDRMSATLEAPDGRAYPLDLWRLVSSGFSTLGDKAEWRVTLEKGQMRPFALILRFIADRPEGGDPISYLTVSKIGAGEICLTDVIPPTAGQNEKARAAAAKAAGRPCYSGSEPPMAPAPPLAPPPPPGPPPGSSPALPIGRYLCPPDLITTQQSGQPLSGWEVSYRPEPNRLLFITFYDGRPTEQVSLVYDQYSEDRRAGTARAEWHFVAPRGSDGIYLSCGYSQTSLLLSKPLPAKLSSCYVDYLLGQTLEGMPVINAMGCK